MRPWRAFLCAWTLDRGADMLWTTVLAWLATSAPSPALQGLILAAAVVPNLFMLLLGGALADKHGSAEIARWTTVAKVALLAVLLVNQVGDGPLLILALVAACLGAVDGFHDPAMESWGTRIRPQNEQTEAAATEATLWRVAQTAGATLGGLLLGLGAVVAVSVAMGLYVVERVFLAVMQRSVEGRAAGEESPEVQGSVVHQIKTGLSFLRQRPTLWATMSTQLACTLTVGSVLMLLVPLVVREQGWPPVTYGLAAGAFGLGMATGAASVMRRQKSGRSRRAAGAVPFAAFAVAAAGHAPLVAITLAPDAIGPVGLVLVLLLFGLLVGPVGPMLTGYRREQTPERLVGVVAGVGRLLVHGPEPLGPLAVGVLASIGGSALALEVVVAVGLGAALCGAVGARLGDRLTISRVQ